MARTMLKTNKLRDLLDANKPTLGTRISSTWPVIAESAASSKAFDYIEFLAEYAPFDQYDLENIARACELHGVGTMIKLDYLNREYIAQRAVASGFQSILFTDHRTKEQVRETLRMIRPDSPQHGGALGYTNRRWIGFRDITPQMEFADMAARTVANFMIEKKEAVENIADICSVPGVDMIQFGPLDYSMNCGFNMKDHTEEVQEAERHVIARAIKHGVRPRAEIRMPDQAEYYLNLGVRDFSLGAEIAVLLKFWKEEGSALRKMIEK
jgi:2-keto-3-deoxy-L-rhamnonate aldolase RhmA